MGMPLDWLHSYSYCVMLLSYVDLWGASWIGVVPPVEINPLPVNL